MEEPINVKEVSKLTYGILKSNGFEIETTSENLKTLTEFRIYLTKKLSKMLDDDYNGVINLLYRIDVDEEELHKLFSSSNKDFIPPALADLIIDRQIEKIKWRLKIENGEI
ncbi:MAG TPA: hypothetical protein VMV36_01455 [Ignavibacteriaceae bacterium]|nr:hypothetical protein [Ignavibacteriaceae bacterium]